MPTSSDIRRYSIENFKSSIKWNLNDGIFYNIYVMNDVNIWFGSIAEKKSNWNSDLIVLNKIHEFNISTSKDW